MFRGNHFSIAINPVCKSERVGGHVLLLTMINPSLFLLFPPFSFSFLLSVFFSPAGMTGNYLLTNPLLRAHDTNNPYNNLLAETIVCNTPSPPVFHSPGASCPSVSS